jgi:predicted enzyme related to lactoylglutathione lyase
MPGGSEYFVARLDADDVAGIATLTPGGAAVPVWTTYVCVEQLERAVRLYAAVFGWNVELYSDPAARTVLLRLPGYIGGRPQQPVPRDVVAVAIEDDRVAANQWSVDFWIDDIEAAVERVVHREGAVIERPSDIAAFRRAVIADPAGAVCTISQLVLDRLP